MEREELEYRQLQRKIGVVDVVTLMLIDFVDDKSTTDQAYKAIEHLRRLKRSLFDRSIEMEKKSGMRW